MKASPASIFAKISSNAPETLSWSAISFYLRPHSSRSEFAFIIITVCPPSRRDHPTYTNHLTRPYFRLSHPLTNSRILPINSRTETKVPRRMA